jgi:hypothetical protein
LPDSRWYSWLRLSYEFLRTVRASNFSCMLCPNFSSCGFFDRFSSETRGRGIILCVHKLLIMKMYWRSGGVYLHASLNLALQLREWASSLGKAPCTETCTGQHRNYSQASPSYTVLPALYVFQQASKMKLLNGENFFYVQAKTCPFFGSTSVL